MEPKQPLLERIIQTVSPSWALSRMRASGMLEMMRKYTGASKGPLTEDWYASNSSAAAEINGDIVTLRNRMRELVRNDGFAYAAVQALANNIIGKGIQPYISGDIALKKKVEKLFMDWCDSLQCDFYGRQNFFGLQQLSTKGMVESGDVIILKRYTGKGKKTQLSLQILESDYLVHWYCQIDIDGFPKGTYVYNGIYFDSQDRIIGYELYEEHPGNGYVTNLNHFFVSVENCIFCFRPDRPGQHRGVPQGHSVMLEHKMLGQYELAQAHKQTTSALFALYIKTNNTAEFGGGTAPKTTDETKYPNLSGERITPGTIQYLLPGEDISPANPPTIDGYDEYTKNRLRKIAKGWGISYEVLSGDLSNVNFSSGRMGWIEMHRNIESWQNLVIIPMICNRIWGWWIETEQLKGNLPLDLSGIQVDWTPPRREMLDPVKETNAMISQMLAGMKSYPGVIRELGENPWKLMAEIEANNKDLDKQNLVFSSDFRKIHEEKMKTSKSDGNPN